MGETDLLLEVGNYQVSQDGTLSVVNGYEPKNGNAYVQTSIIANHAPLVKRIIRYDNGTDITEKIEIAVRRAYKESIAHMTKDQLFAQNPNKAFDVGNIVYQGRGYNGLYRQFIQEQCVNLPIYTVYQHTTAVIVAAAVMMPEKTVAANPHQSVMPLPPFNVIYSVRSKSFFNISGARELIHAMAQAEN